MVNKTADWPVVRQVEVRRDLQTTKEHKKEREVSGVARRHREKQGETVVLKKGAIT